MKNKLKNIKRLPKAQLKAFLKIGMAIILYAVLITWFSNSCTAQVADSLKVKSTIYLKKKGQLDDVLIYLVNDKKIEYEEHGSLHDLAIESIELICAEKWEITFNAENQAVIRPYDVVHWYNGDSLYCFIKATKGKWTEIYVRDGRKLLLNYIHTNTIITGGKIRSDLNSSETVQTFKKSDSREKSINNLTDDELYQLGADKADSQLFGLAALLTTVSTTTIFPPLGVFVGIILSFKNAKIPLDVVGSLVDNTSYQAGFKNQGLHNSLRSSVIGLGIGSILFMVITVPLFHVL